MAARSANDMLMSDGSMVEPHGWSHLMNLMLATLTAKDRFEAFVDEVAADRQLPPVTTRRGGRIGLRHWAGSLASHLRLTSRGAGA
jgi:hypothetical protein